MIPREWRSALVWGSILAAFVYVGAWMTIGVGPTAKLLLLGAATYGLYRAARYARRWWHEDQLGWGETCRRRCGCYDVMRIDKRG